jgi:Protein of unknown function (DUF3800)
LTDYSENEIAALRLYMDESGGDDPNTPHAVIGGILIFRKAFLQFEAEWDRMLSDHGISDGIHMKEFGPHGKLGHISKCCRQELFSRATYLIENYRAFTIAATISNEQYKLHIVPEVRKRFSLYAMCFNFIIMMNHKLAENSKYDARIPFIMDVGNPYAGHVRDAHAFMLTRMQKQIYRHVGSLVFEDDKSFGVLQAADIIAWGTRRRLSNLGFPPGLEAINKLVSDPRHLRSNWEPRWLADLNDGLATAIKQRS